VLRVESGVQRVARLSQLANIVKHATATTKYDHHSSTLSERDAQTVLEAKFTKFLAAQWARGSV